jgi:uncharacterized membrane protein YphA (DoxX/SURF4 family)
LAIVFAGSGGAKLAASAAAVALFTAFHLPLWTLYFVGALEIITAVLLVRDATRSYGAMAVCALMTGAAISHLTSGADRWMLLVNMALFTTGLVLVMRDRPAFLRIDWAHEPHRTGITAPRPSA